MRSLKAVCTTQTRLGRCTPAMAALLTGCTLAAVIGMPVLQAQAGTAPAASEGAPKGWFLAGSKPQSYRTGVEQGGAAYMASRLPDTGGFGTLMQSIQAGNYAGKRIRLQASVRSEGVSAWAGLWMRADKGKAAVAFDNMESRAIKGTTSLSTYDVVLDVPPDATGISFGALVSGAGEVWLDHISFESVGHDVTTTGSFGETDIPLEPVNLDFRQR